MKLKATHCHPADRLASDPSTPFCPGLSEQPFTSRAGTLVVAGRSVGDIARDLGIGDQTVYSWRRQRRIDQGLEAGLTSGERAELVAARPRIRELETELAIHRKAAELLEGTARPKGGSRPSK